jgi:hypothetical protein
VTNGAIFGGAIAALCTVEVLRCLHSGHVAMRWPDLNIYKTQEPDRYWFIVALYGFVAVAGWITLALS